MHYLELNGIHTIQKRLLLLLFKDLDSLFHSMLNLLSYAAIFIIRLIRK